MLGLVPLLLIMAAIGSFAALGAPGIGERRGPPAEELAVERTKLTPGIIELTVRNDGPDAVQVAQVIVNDAFVNFEGAESEIGRLETAKLQIQQPWIEGEAYEVALLTSAGTTIAHEIPAAVETPTADASFFWLMALLGIYVGVIPVALGMLWLPWVRRIPPPWMRFLMALTIGLLGFLAIDATLEGMELAGEGSQAFGGQALVFVGAIVAFLALTGVSAWLRDRRRARESEGASPATLAMLVAIGIGLHNLGEGLAIGTAYTTGALALGAFLVVGFALHNTTEGLAIVAPIARAKPSLARLGLLGLIAGAPAVLGAWIGAAAFNTSVAAFLFGAGAGAIAQVIVQLAPSLRDEEGRALHPRAVGGLLAGLALMFVDRPAGDRLMATSHTGQSHAIEDYAKAIYALQRRNDGEPVSTNKLAERCGVTPASASAMVKKLAERDLAIHEPYRGVMLTPAGERLALEMLRHHRLLELYLAEHLDVPVGPRARGGRGARARAVGGPRGTHRREARQPDARPARRPDPRPRPRHRRGRDRGAEQGRDRNRRALRARVGLRLADAALPRRAGHRDRRPLRRDRAPAVRRPDHRALRRRRAHARTDARARDADRDRRRLKPRATARPSGQKRRASGRVRCALDDHRAGTYVASR